MQFDDILKVVGGFGRFQKVKYFLLCLLSLTTAFQALVSVFSIYTPKHRCSLPADVFNDTDTWQNQSAVHSKLVDTYIPKLEDGSYDTCQIYVYDSESNGTLQKCDSWVYERTEMLESVVTKWDLVCDKKLMATLSASLFMFGNLVGSVISGILSDFLGRRKTLLSGVLGMIISGVIMAFAPEFYSFSVCRFFMGCFNLQVFLTAFVMGMEMIGPEYRLVAGIVIELFWALGFLILIAVAYFIRQWSYIQLAITLPSLFFISYYWLMPESARWLLAKGRGKDAEKVIAMVARANKRNMPPGLIEQLEEPKEPESLKAILKARTLFLRTAVVFFNWFVVSMAYYGLSLNSGNMPGSLYVNMTLSAVAEVIAYSLCFICFVAGRKKIHILSMVIGGLACICSIPVLYFVTGDEEAKNWYFVALNTVGKVGITMGFAIIYFWCAEIFPTLIRNSLMGGSSMFARVGSIFAPIIADIGKVAPPEYSQMLAPLIFGVLTIAGGLLSIALPETTGMELPETIAQANVFPHKLEDDNSGQDEDKPMYKEVPV